MSPLLWSRLSSLQACQRFNSTFGCRSVLYYTPSNSSPAAKISLLPWRTHSCVPRRHSCRRLALSHIGCGAAVLYYTSLNSSLPAEIIAQSALTISVLFLATNSSRSQPCGLSESSAFHHGRRKACFLLALCFGFCSLPFSRLRGDVFSSVVWLRLRRIVGFISLHGKHALAVSGTCRS